MKRKTKRKEEQVPDALREARSWFRQQKGEVDETVPPTPPRKKSKVFSLVKGKKATCYVCGRWAYIRELLEVEKGHAYRHGSKCRPGSESWMKHMKGRSSWYRYYEAAYKKKGERNV